MQSPSYQYQPLQHSNSIRILVLHPSPNESDPIECTICHEDLANGFLEYEAVSYTWGSSDLTHTVHCNDTKQELSIGRNCHAALRRLRLPEHCRYLWIDAVCINQADLSERGHQVRMMKDIYDFASGVMVMLDDNVPNCGLLLDELAEATRILDELAEAGMELDRRAKPPVRNRPSAAIVRELETFFDDPWFKRTWVLQEVYDKSLVTIVYGSATIPIDAIKMLYFGYSGTRVTRTSWPLPLRLMTEDLDEYTTSQFCLWNLLFRSRKCLATDPRDNVFALKSLVGLEQEQLNHLIDYAESVESCFKRTAIFLLPILGLRLLTATRHPHGLGMASWIPDWSQTLPLSYATFYFEAWNCDPDECVFSPINIEDQKRALSSYLYAESHISPTLHVFGCQYARIVECSHVLQFVDIDDVERQMHQMYNHFNNLRLCMNEESKSESVETPNHFSGEILNAMSLMDGMYLDSNLRRCDCLYPQVNGKLVIDIRAGCSDFYESLQDCSIALMQDGGLAIVPGAAQDGDVVCILEGAVAPCLLRQCRDEWWILVSGDCHIFGDDPYTMTDSYAYVDSHRSQAERFVLV